MHTNTIKEASNGYIKSLDYDNLYHLGMTTRTHDFHELFGDIKFVCCGGSSNRMKKCAQLFAKEFNYDQKIENLINSDRYVMYKVGSVLCVSHGIGTPSASVLLHELFKLVKYAKCQNVIFFRVGTSGGIGCEPGTVVVSDGALNGLLEPYYECCVLGERVRHSVHVDHDLVDRIFEVGKKLSFPVVKGKTLCADDFYEGQARLDGAFCSYGETEKMKFLRKVYDAGVRNIEMEATAFSAMVHRAGFKNANVCVTLLNRLVTDQVQSPVEVLKSWEERPCLVVCNFIKSYSQASSLL